MKRKFWIVLMMAVSVLAGCGNVEGTMAEERASGEQQSVVDEVTEGVETEEESSEGSVSYTHLTLPTILLV